MATVDQADDVGVFLSGVYAEPDIDRGIDKVFEYFDSACYAEKFAHCDAILAAVDIGRLDPSVMIAFLTITLCIRDRLENREPLKERIRERLTIDLSPQRTANILKGL